MTLYNFITNSVRFLIFASVKSNIKINPGIPGSIRGEHDGDDNKTARNFEKRVRSVARTRGHVVHASVRDAVQAVRK